MTRLSARLSAGLAAAIAITSLAAPAAAQCEPEWRSLRGGVEGTWYGEGPLVRALQVFDDGSGPALYVGGAFRTAGGTPALNIARWNGRSWQPVGDGVAGEVTSMAVFDDGSGPALYVGSWMSSRVHVERWDGSSWTTVGESGPSGSVMALAVFDDGSGSALYAAGLFSQADGVPARNIARWDGHSWSSLGSESLRGMVHGLIVFDDGSGPALYVGGNISGAGDVSARGVIRWDGDQWLSLGHESSQDTMDFGRFAVHDDGSGPALYAHNFFCDSTGCPRGGGVLRWDGELWRQVGGDFHGHAAALASLDTAAGPGLYVGGRFTSIGGEPVERLARWDGASWSPVAGGIGALPYTGVRAITTFDEGSGPTLFVAGEFYSAGGIDVSGIAAFGCAPPACYADCDDNGALDIFDFLCFQNLFAAADPAADCDESGSLDFGDFLCFQNAFAAGCP